VPSSRADRPYGAFLKPHRAEPITLPQLTGRQRLRRGFQRALPRARAPALVVAGALLAILGIALGGALAQAPSRLTQTDVDKQITQALASATPKPNVAIAAYEGIKESVVQVKVRGRDESATQPRGAGVLLDTGGMVLTSLHVVRDAIEITVVFFDGEEADAVLGVSDLEFDVALLEVGASGRRPAVLASAKDLRVGGEAFVVGSPLGLRNSLTVGVISRLGSSFQPPWQSRPIGGLIQFDAALYPGNSGGPLVNRRGEVIGIVTGGANPVGLSGIGFAVPIDSAASAAGSNPF